MYQKGFINGVIAALFLKRTSGLRASDNRGREYLQGFRAGNRLLRSKVMVLLAWLCLLSPFLLPALKALLHVR